MAILCPRCGQQKLQRRAAGRGAMMFGVVGALFAAAGAPYVCPACGEIPPDALPPEVRTRRLVNSLIMILVALGLLGLVIWLFVFVWR
jgi:predicted RNA-binding Zn-ribbon protein involved in translation (DUF1610 family)